MNTLLDLFLNGASINRNAPAVRWDDGGEFKEISYGDLEIASRVVADELDCLGIVNEIISLSSTPKITTLCAVVGILKAGAAFAFLNLKAAIQINTNFYEKLGIKYVILDEDELTDLKFLTSFCIIKRIQCVPSTGHLVIVELKTVRRKHLFQDYSLAYCVETSGSTGRPKLVKVSHKCIVPNVLDFCEQFGVNSLDQVFLSSPLTFDPSVVDIFISFAKGACVLLVPEEIKLMTNKLLDILTLRNKVTIIQATPSFMKRFGSEKLKNSLLASDTSLRILSLGGEKCPTKYKLLSWKNIHNKTQFFNVYGVTEVSSWALIHPIEFDGNEESYYDISLGKPIFGTEFEVIDSEGDFITKSGVGQLYLGGRERICFIGWEDYSVVSKHPMRPTGDLVRIDDGGNLYYIRRLDDQIKRNGKKIAIGRVEWYANMHNEVEDCKLIYDEEKEILILATILNKENGNSSFDILTCLKNHLARNIPNHSRPDYVVAVNEFPITRHGKIDKQRLLQLSQIQIDLPLVTTLAYDTIVNPIIKLWKNYLGNDTAINFDSNFILSGGNSLNTVQLSSDIQLWLHNKYLPNLIEKLLNEDLKAVCEYILAAEDNPHSSQKDYENISALSVPFHVKNEEIPGVVSPKDKHLKLISRANRKVISNQTNYSESLLLKVNLFEEWHFDTSKCVDSSPFLIHTTGFGSVVYIGSHSHYFYAVCLETGTLKWKFKTADRIESTACATSNGLYLFFGGYDKYLYCVDAITGLEKWRFQVDGIIKCSPVYDSIYDCVYFGAYDHYFYAVKADNGNCFWKTLVSNASIFSSPILSIDPHYIYFGTLDGILACLSPQDGKIIWKYNFDKPIFSSCCLVSNGICVGGIDNNIYCFSHGGQKLWEFATEEPIFSSPCALLSHSAKEVVFCGSHDQHLYCVNVEQGDLIWKTKLDAPIYSSPFVTSVEETNLHAVMVSSTKGTFYCLNTSDGKVIAEHHFLGETFSSPIVFNNRVIIGCRDNNVYCLKINNVNK